MTTIPDRLPSRTLDIALHFMATMCDPSINVVIDLDGHLDEDRLRRALRLLLDAEPVMGSVYVPRFCLPYWQRLERGELDGAELLEVQDGEVDARVERQRGFLAEPTDTTRGPRIRGLLLRGEHDRLVLKIDHQTADAGGAKDVIYRLAEIYRALGGDPGHVPEPRLGTRSLRLVYRRLLPWCLPQLLVRMLRDTRASLLPPTHLLLPMDPVREGPPEHHTRHFDAERVRLLAGNELGATLNDVFIAGFLRSLVRVADWNGTDVLRLWGTCDLRRYIPDRRADGVCNLTGFMYQRYGTDLGDRYEDTLARVKAVMDEIKGWYPGLGYPLTTWLTLLPWPLGVTRLLLGPFRKHMLVGGGMPPVLTNMGPIDEQLLDFGDPAVEYAWLVVPTSYPAGFMAGLSGFRGRITMTANHYPSAVSREKIVALLDGVDDELP